MILSQFEQAVWHRRGSDCDIAEAWHHGGEIVSAVEAVLEFGEVAGYMLVADGAVSASDGALDIAEGGVDPLEGRVQDGLATGSSDDRLVDAAGVADCSEAVQAITDNGAGGMEIALRQGRDFGMAETLHAAQLQADWLVSTQREGRVDVRGPTHDGQRFRSPHARVSGEIPKHVWPANNFARTKKQPPSPRGG